MPARTPCQGCRDNSHRVAELLGSSMTLASSGWRLLREYVGQKLLSFLLPPSRGPTDGANQYNPWASWASWFKDHTALVWSIRRPTYFQTLHRLFLNGKFFKVL